MGNPPACIECGQVIGKVTAAVDPKRIGGHIFTIGCTPSPHRIDREFALALYDMGYRWDLPAVSGASLGAAERDRQVTEKGYTPDHDDAQDWLPWAAFCELDRALHPTDDPEPPNAWPEGKRWNPDQDPLQRLVRVLGYVEAELDRRLRILRAKS